MKIVYLEPQSSFRNNLRSDTLWGLICWGIKTVFSEQKLEEFIDKHKEKPVKISSVFPYKREGNEDKSDGQKKRFFPRPILQPLNLNHFFESNGIDKKSERAQYIADLKKFKKIKYVEESIFEKFLKGELNETDFFLNKELWDTKEEFYKEEDVLHNSIDRLTNTTPQPKEGNKRASLYSTTELFIKNGGLFFLLDGYPEQIELVEAALRFFSHVGFGGDSSTGKGYFKISLEDINFTESENADAFITLSLFLPSDDEVAEFKKRKSNMWYELEARKGKFGGHFVKINKFWKESVLMFKESSVFPKLDKAHYGKIKKVMSREQNGMFDVYHYGVAFDLPIKLKRED